MVYFLKRALKVINIQFYQFYSEHLFNNFILETAIEWRIIGQEQDGILLTSWVFSGPNFKPNSNIGVYNPVDKSFDILYKFSERENVIQASVNGSRSLLLFVIKNIKIEVFHYSLYVFFLNEF